MTLWFRLLLAMIVVVSTALLLSGGITWFLVSRLLFQNAEAQLEDILNSYRFAIARAACITPHLEGHGCTTAATDTPTILKTLPAVINDKSLLPNGEHLLVLSQESPPRVIYDSQGQIKASTQVSFKPTSFNGNTRFPVGEGTLTLGGNQYVFSSTQLSNRFPLQLMLIRPSQDVIAQATLSVLPKVLGAALAGLVLSVIVSFLLARNLSHPVKELTAAAGDIAKGNYARRVEERRPGEFGVLARAFNRMTEMVESSRQQQREFLTDVSHELKTPLTSLIGFSAAMGDGSLRTDKERARAAVIISEESQRVLRLSQELLDLARVEAGHITYHLQPVDLTAHLEQQVEMVRLRSESRRLALQVDTPPDLPPVQADPERLYQLLSNLFDNAAKYAPEGDTVEIIVRAEGSRVATEVSNAVANHRPDPQKMFDRFYRADPSRSAAAGGAGLGLAISFELATAMDGELSAYLQEDRLHMRLVMPIASQ